jgi:hypothetical protein
MRKIVLSLAALAALILVIPYAAPAKADETVIVHHGDGDWHHHRHHHHPVVVIKHRHDY